MTPDLAINAVFGAGVGIGVLLFAAGCRGTSMSLPPWLSRALTARWRRPRIGKRVILALGVAVVVVLTTGWPVGGVLAAMAMWGLPRALGSQATHAEAIARIEAIGTWTESLRDTLRAAAGLEQAILATAATAPHALRTELAELATALDQGEPLVPGLRRLADRLTDPTADLVISALVLAADKHARQLADLLGELAAETRAQVSMRLRVETGRARTRTSVRMIVAVTLVFAAGLTVLNRSYLTPFDTVVGQCMLAAVGALFTVAFGWLSRMATYQVPQRFLTDLGAPPAGADAATVSGEGGR